MALADITTDSWEEIFEAGVFVKMYDNILLLELNSEVWLTSRYSNFNQFGF